jgi:hypothetical protein
LFVEFYDGSSAQKRHQRHDLHPEKAGDVRQKAWPFERGDFYISKFQASPSTNYQIYRAFVRKKTVKILTIKFSGCQNVQGSDERSSANNACSQYPRKLIGSASGNGKLRR